MRRKVLFLLLAIMAVFAGARVYYFLTDDFRLSNISYPLPHIAEWETPLPTHEEHAILVKLMEQPFTYIGKGAQVYAFGSQDGEYVLKLFKFKHIRPQFYLKWLPSTPYFNNYREQKTAQKLEKVKSIFSGYKIAYDRDKDNTALLYIHLNKGEGLNLVADLHDKMGREFRINLDDTVFVIQKRGVTLRTKLSEDLQRNDLASAKKHIRAIFDMYLVEYSRGLYDRDHGVPQNTGFLDETPFHLDVGKFSYGEEYKNKEFYERDLTWVSLMIRSWILTKFPLYEKSLTKDMEQYLSEKMGRPVDLVKLQPTLQGGKKPPLSP